MRGSDTDSPKKQLELHIWLPCCRRELQLASRPALNDGAGVGERGLPLYRGDPFTQLETEQSVGWKKKNKILTLVC